MFQRYGSETDCMSSNDKDQKPKKFFGMEISYTLTYVIVLLLTIIFIRQVAALF
jgi:hypothetical protein